MLIVHYAQLKGSKMLKSLAFEYFLYNNNASCSDEPRWLFVPRARMINDYWRAWSLNDWKDTNILDTNLLICATRSVKFHSQAYILTTRIPVMIAFIISNRLSVTAADCWRIFPALWAANDPYAITRRKKEAPIKACHATKYHTRTTEATMSSGTNGSEKMA